MARDLFAATFDRKAGPRRSKWTIAGSFLAHTTLLAALLILPVLSAFDSYVVQARNIAFLVPPPPVIPAIPVQRPQTAAPVPQDVKINAAPVNPSQEPVKGDAVTNIGPPAPPGWLPIGPEGGGVPGTGKNVIDLATTTPPPPVQRKPVPVGGDIKPPAKVFNVNPIYPSLAQTAHLEGMVILEATIDETGVVKELRVLRSAPMFDQAALDAVRRWRYTPTRLNGVAVPVLLTVTVTFSLR